MGLPAGEVADPLVVGSPSELEATKDKREFAAHMDDQHLQLWVAIEHTGARSSEGR